MEAMLRRLVANLSPRRLGFNSSPANVELVVEKVALQCSITDAIYSQQSTSLTFWLRDAPASLTFNNCTFCPHCIYVLCKQRLVPLTVLNDWFYNRDEKCLQRGTDWVFK
jgi:hypothetical protein